MKRIVNPKFSLSLIFIFATLSIFAQSGDKVEKTYKWTYDLEADGIVEINNYDCDIIIHIWDKDAAELQLSVMADMKSDKDAETINKHIENLEFSSAPSRVSFDTKFWLSKKQIVLKKTIRLKKGTTLSYSEIKTKAEVWIPRSADLDIKSKYSKIDLPEIGGKLSLNLYNDDLKGKSVIGNLNIKAKYTTVEFDNVGDVDADLYSCNFTAIKTGNSIYASKYSKISTTLASDLQIESYNDKYLVETSGNINITSKYTDLTTKDAGKVVVDSYEGSFGIANCKDLEIKAKYTDFLNESAEDLVVTNIYEGSISSIKINSLRITESKYVEYKLAMLNKSLILTNGYNDDFFIDELGSDFSGIELNGKYIKCETVISNNLKFKVKANIKYANLDFEKLGLTTKLKIQESSQLEYEAFKGEDNGQLPLISLNGYEIAFKVR